MCSCWITNSHRQRGAALITALLVVTLATIAAVAMLADENLAIHRTENIRQSEEAWWYAVGMEQWARTILEREHKAKQTVALDQPWARRQTFLPIQHGSLSGRLIDLQGRFNLNNLAGPGYRVAEQQFTRLLESVPGVGPSRAEALAQAVRDWVDPDIDPQLPFGAEDDYYLGLKPAYRTANRLMDSPSELLLIKGFTPEIYRALRPDITALPSATPLNVNTATVPVLAALAPGLGLEQIKTLAKARVEKPFETVQAFLAEGAMAGHAVTGQGLSVTSHYFLAEIEAHVGDVRVKLYSLLYRNDQGITQVIEHNRGSL